MNVILQTGAELPWAAPLRLPWPLLPIGNRPWLEYWVEWCVQQSWRELQVVLGEGAYEVERYLGDGARWGVSIRYSLLRPGSDPDAFLRRDPARWCGTGLFYLRQPLFPRRLTETPPEAPPGPCHAAHGAEGLTLFFRREGSATPLEATGATPFPGPTLAPWPLASLRDYFELNQALVAGEMGRYLTPGYRRGDGAYLGYNVVTPPAARLTAPLIIGNNVMLRPLCSVGPRAILGSRVIVDRQAEIADALVLDGTYIGVGIELKGRIVAGRRLIDPQDGTWLELADPQLLDRVRQAGAAGEQVRRLAHRLLALLLWLLVAPAALVALTLGRLRGGRFTRRRRLGVRGAADFPAWCPGGGGAGLLARLSLDRWPLLLCVARGDLWLCGQLAVRPEEEEEAREWPAYRPGLFTPADTRPDGDDPVMRRLEAAYYAHHRGWREDARVLLQGWWGRLTARDRDPFGSAHPTPEADA